MTAWLFFTLCEHHKEKDTVYVCLCHCQVISWKTLQQKVLCTKDEALISQIRGEDKQNRINIGVLVQVKGLICYTELNSCTSCNVFIASFHCLPKHHSLQLAQCHMSGCVVMRPLGLCFNSFLYCAPM